MSMLGWEERWWRWKRGSIKKNMPSVSGLITTDLTSKQHGRQLGATVPLNMLNYRCFCVWVLPRYFSGFHPMGLSLPPSVCMGVCSFLCICVWFCLSLCVTLRVIPSYCFFLNSFIRFSVFLSCAKVSASFPDWFYPQGWEDWRDDCLPSLGVEALTFGLKEDPDILPSQNLTMIYEGLFVYFVAIVVVDN